MGIHLSMISIRKNTIFVLLHPQKMRDEKTGEILDCQATEELYLRIQRAESALSGGTQQPDTSVRDGLRHRGGRVAQTVDFGMGGGCFCRRTGVQR